MKNKLVFANHKMALNSDRINRYIEELENKNLNNLIVCPSYLYIDRFVNHGFTVGGQNVASVETGVTGEVSAYQLHDLGAKYVICGHSERRNHQKESFEEINKKLKLALENDLTPILCVGETLAEREDKLTIDVIKGLIDLAFNSGIDKEIIIAYEPIWSIGTKEIAGNDELELILKFIKTYILDNYKIKVTVLYGGSVDLSNIERLKTIESLDGFLIGGSSLDANQLEMICKLV